MMDSLRVIDSHVHFWDPAVLTYPWIEGNAALDRAFLPADLTSLGDGYVDGVVFVEANCRPSQNIAELEFVERLITQEPRIRGIVPFVDLLDPEGRSRALRQIVGRRHVVGARHNIQGNHAGFALQPEFVRGVLEVGGAGLVFDLCVTGNQLAETTELVRRCPGTRFVLDHCGKPAIRDDRYEPWATELSRLAEHENVACKLSGIFSEARDDQRNADGLHAYVSHVMASFGPARLLYGSDWPVVSAAGDEPAWRALAAQATSSWTLADRQSFFFDNAVKIYGLTGKRS